MTAGDLLSSVRHARSPLAWCAEYARDGDPLPAAWAACDEPKAMVDALVRNRVLWARAYNAWLDSLGHHGCTHVGYCATCARAVRTAVPTITAAEVL